MAGQVESQPASVVSARDDWDRHWRDYHETARLNPAQDFRRRLVLQHLLAGGAAARELKVVDIGSGPGDFAREFLHRFAGASYLGLEYSRSGVEIAQAKVPQARFLQRDLLEPQSPPDPWRGWANHGVCSEVLEHVDEPALLLSNVQPYLAPGARLIVTVPGGPVSAFDRHIGHRRHFTPADLAEVMQQAGYEVEGTWGAGFPFFNLYRMTVIARGEKLIHDVSGETSGTSRRLSRAVMSVFAVLFKLNACRSTRGWQTVGVARYPGRGRP